MLVGSIRRSRPVFLLVLSRPLLHIREMLPVERSNILATCETVSQSEYASEELVPFGSAAIGSLVTFPAAGPTPFTLASDAIVLAKSRAAM